MQQPNRRVAALIVAAGEGRRMQGREPKAFIPLKGKPLLAHAIQPFEDCQRIESVYPVLRSEDFPSWQEKIIRRFPFKKTRNPLAGGLRRQDSVRLGLESIKESVDIILIHDGARPLVEPWMLERLIDTLEGGQADGEPGLHWVSVTATDDSMLVERLGVPVTVVKGSYKNIKVTTREDLITARALIEDRERYHPNGERGE